MTHHGRQGESATEVSREELESQTGEQLPEREAMSLIDPSGTLPPVPIEDGYDAPPNPVPDKY